MSQSVYIETSVVSYCAARPSTHIITAAKQAITRTWWEQESPRFSLYISTVVEREASRGDPGAARKRIRLIHDLPLLAITTEVEELALHLIGKHLLPAHSEEDALHIAIASVHGMNYLLTWNFKHIIYLFFRSALPNGSSFTMCFIDTKLCLIGLRRSLAR